MVPPSLMLVLLALAVPLSLSSSSSSSSELLEVSVELEDFVRYQPEQVHLSINGESNLSSRNCKSSGFCDISYMYRIPISTYRYKKFYNFFSRKWRFRYRHLVHRGSHAQEQGSQQKIFLKLWTFLTIFLPKKVEFGLVGPEHLDSTAEGSSTRFVDGGRERRAQFIHRVELRNLRPNSTYCEGKR